MIRAALALLLFSGCAPNSAEAAYREEVGCYGLFFYAGSPSGEAARDAFRARALASGRNAGHDPDEVGADAESVSTNFIREMQGRGAEAIQQRQDQLEAACRQRLSR